MNPFVKLIPYLIALVLLVGVFLYVKNLGKTECENEQKSVIIEGIKDREKIEHKNKSLEHNDIVDRLDDGGWLRPE